MSNSSSIRGKEVLIIDDASDSRLIARKILENIGMIPSEAESVADALSSLEKKVPHLILLDLHMLGVSGFDFLAERARDATLAQVPVIVVSATADKDTVYRSIGLGASDYVVKPLVASVLMRKVRRVLKDGEFKSLRFPEKKPEKAVLHFQAEISRPAETEFFLESNLKIAADTRLRLSSPQLDEMGMKSCVYVAAGIPNVRGSRGNYFTRVNVLGLAQTLSRLLKKLRKK